MNPIPAMRRRGETTADTRTLEQLGGIGSQPIPSPSIQLFQEPAYDPPLEPVDDELV